ncbi:hypothetical protein [Phytoactinopolyspora limicola]|uniref:hypothetical protein n=1 Tax=Phytoactinopolyspora limicola TaxID=2715536 RepID=UPI0014080BC0|nr:hypothetical protein [Phytoactinopolyspora limicola]
MIDRRSGPVSNFPATTISVLVGAMAWGGARSAVPADDVGDSVEDARLFYIHRTPHAGTAAPVPATRAGQTSELTIRARLAGCTINDLIEDDEQPQRGGPNPRHIGYGIVRAGGRGHGWVPRPPRGGRASRLA